MGPAEDAEPASDAAVGNHRPERGPLACMCMGMQVEGQILRGIAAAASLLGTTMWLFGNVLTATFLGVAGMVIPEHVFSGERLTAKTFDSSVVLGLAIVLIGVLAPMIQALVPVVMALDGPKASDSPVVKILREADAFACSDVILAGMLAFWMNIDDIAKWIGRNQFPELVDGIHDLSGVEAIGMTITPWVVGSLGVTLATFASLGLYISNARADLRLNASSEGGCRRGTGSWMYATEVSMPDVTPGAAR